MIQNNRLTSVSDNSNYDNVRSENLPGLEQRLNFACGVHGETTVDGWQTRPSPK